MPPALDKTLEKDHRIHVSSPVLTHDSSKDMNPQIKLMDDSYTKFWLNLSSLSVLDSCSIKSSLELPETSLVYNSESCEMDLQAGLGSLLQSGADCPSLGEDYSLKERTAAEGQSSVSKDYQNWMQTLSPLQYLQRKSKHFSSARSNRNKNRSQHNALTVHCSAIQAEVEARRMQLASQHRVLATRTDRAKLKLHALLGENTLRSFNKQLEQLRRKLSPTSIKTRHGPLSQWSSHGPTINKCVNTLGLNYECEPLPDHSSGQKSPRFCGPAVQQGSETFGNSSEDSLVEKSSERLQINRSVQNLVQCGQAVLRKAQKALDSDATESSSDDEWEEKTRRKRPSQG